MPSRNAHNFSFGAGPVGVTDYATGEEVGTFNLISGFESAGLAGEVVVTEGGALQHASSARTGRVNGELTFTAREMPPFLFDILSGVGSQPIPQVDRDGSTQARVFEVSSSRTIAGTFAGTPTIIAHQAAQTTSTGDVVSPLSPNGIVRGTVFIDGEGSDMVHARASSNLGREDLGSVEVGTAGDMAINFGQLGFALTMNAAIADGVKIAVDFTNSHGAGRTWRVGPYHRNTAFHKLNIYSSIGSNDDDLYVFRYGKVILHGGKNMTADNAANQESVEFKAQILVPDDGSAVLQHDRLPPQTA